MTSAVTVQDLLLLNLILFVSIQNSEAVSRIYKNSTKCYYLEMSDGQTANAYSPKSKPSLTCCMCSRGTLWTGDCNEFNPTSTKCDPCHYNDKDPHDRYFIDFEPHLQHACFRSISTCPHPQVIFEGSTTENSKCVCPPGMMVGKTNEDCILDPTMPTTASKTAKLATSDITTIPHTTQTPQTTNAIKRTLLDKITTHDTLAPTADVKNDIKGDEEPTQKSYTQHVTTPVERTEIETMLPNSDQNDNANEHNFQGTNSVIGWVVGAVLFLVILLIGVYCCFCRNSTTHIVESPEGNRKVGATQSNESSPNNSSTVLVSGQNQNQSTMKKLRTSLQQAFQYGENRPPKNMAEPSPNQQHLNRTDEVVAQSPENESLMRYYRREERVHQDTANPLPNEASEQNHVRHFEHTDNAPPQVAHVQRQTEPSPVQPAQSYQNIGHQTSAAMRPDEDAQASSPQGPVQSHAIINGSPQPQVRLDGRPQLGLNQVERPSLNERQRNEYFVLDVAKEIGEKLDVRNAMPWFRLLIGKETSSMRDTYNTYTNPPHTDTRELYYRLMKIAVEELGARLTSNYLLKKAQEYELQILVDIIEEKMGCHV